MHKAHTIDVQLFIDSQPFSRFQKIVLLLCFLIVAIDGFDTASIGFIAPAICSEWHLSAAALAPLFGVGLFGLMAGALLLGPLADRYGRKPILLFSVLFFGFSSLASAFAQEPGTLLLMRFLTGLGLGGAMPSAITLTSEYCPQQRRSGLVTLMFCGFTTGSALGGLASAHLLNSVGWRGVLALGGILPLALAPVLLFALPESLRWLAMRGRGGRRVACRIAPHLSTIPNFIVLDRKPVGSPVAELFRHGLLCGTLLLWLAFFMSLLIIYLLSSWLPTLLNSIGKNLSDAALITTMFQIGGDHRCHFSREMDGPFQSLYRANGSLSCCGHVYCRGRPLGIAYLATGIDSIWRGLWRKRFSGGSQCFSRSFLSHEQPRHGC